MSKQVINVRVNHGEPTDGTGKVCIHLFVHDERGAFVEPHGLHVATDDDGRQQIVARPTRGRLACDPRRRVAPVSNGRATTVTPRTDDPRAVTCPKCMASADYADKIRLLAGN